MKIGTVASLRWRGFFLAMGVGLGLLACSGEEGAADPATPGQGGSGGSSAGGSSGGGSGGTAGGSSGSGGASSGSGGGGGDAGVGGSSAGSGGSNAGTGGSAGEAGCSKDEDCADKLPSTVNPPSCAEALCEGGTCVFRARDKDGDGKRAKFCKDTSGEAEIVVGNDCDDNDKTVFPGAWDGPEGDGNAASCDGVDNDCSGAPDDNVLADGTSCSCKPGAVQTCSQTAGGKTIDWPLGKPEGTCKYGEQKCVIDDATGVGKWGPCIGAIEPTTESCNKDDDDCDGKVDEPEDAPVSTWYYDGDGDGFAALVPGTKTPFATIIACFKPEQVPEECMAPGYCPGEPGSCCPPAAWKTSLTALDCDDRTDKVSPLAKEVCNGIDDNCNDQLDEFGALGEKTYIYDQDDDGFSNPNITPFTSCSAPTEPPSDCAAPPCPLSGWKEQGPSIQGGDCNDNSAAIKPGAQEICDDAKTDENCNGTGNEGCACANGEQQDCGSPDTCNFISKGSTCVNGLFTLCPEPRLKESFCLDKDNDLFCLDGKSCGLYCPSSTPAGQGPKAPAGYRLKSTCAAGLDCNDNAASTYPGAQETCGDGVDRNCDGNDSDGFNLNAPCDAGSGQGACKNGGATVCNGLSSTSCQGAPGLGSSQCRTTPLRPNDYSSWDWDCDGKAQLCANLDVQPIVCAPQVSDYEPGSSIYGQSGALPTKNDVINYAQPASSKVINPCGSVVPNWNEFCAARTGQASCSTHLFFTDCCDGSGGFLPFTCNQPCGKKAIAVRCRPNIFTNACEVDTATLCTTFETGCH